MSGSQTTPGEGLQPLMAVAVKEFERQVATIVEPDGSCVTFVWAEHMTLEDKAAAIGAACLEVMGVSDDEEAC